MQFEARSKDVSISLEPGETENRALTALVRASYESAPVNRKWPPADHQKPLSDTDIQLCLRLPPRMSDKVVIQMDQLHGRICKTIVIEERPGHFLFRGSLFSAYRAGNPQTVVVRANELLGETST